MRQLGWRLAVGGALSGIADASAPGMKRLFVLLSLFALVLACAPALDTGGLVLRTDRDRYAAGSAVVLTLSNGGATEVGYNLCSSTLERRTGSGWEAQRVDLVCTMELRGLAPGSSASFTHTLPAALAAGEYRYSTRVEERPGGAMRSVATDSFTVG